MFSYWTIFQCSSNGFGRNFYQEKKRKFSIKKRIVFNFFQFAPLQIVGMEGIWGVILMAIIILPIMQFIPGSDQGSYENSVVIFYKKFYFRFKKFIKDAFIQIGNNNVLLSMIILYWISIAFYNFCGLAGK